MLSFCRSGLLVLTLVSAPVAFLHAQTQRTTHQTWVSDVSVERLEDQSVLTEYFGKGVSEQHADVIFRVGFIPRFGCAPLITVQFGADALTYQRSVADVGSFPMDLGALDVSIDGTALAFPTLVDNNKYNTSVYLNTDLQRRITTRLRIEIGDRMEMRFTSGKVLEFPLAGSRDAISAASQNCRRHDPTQQG